jgi:hypothetical protein
MYHPGAHRSIQIQDSQFSLSICRARESDARANLWEALHYITKITNDVLSRGFCPKIIAVSAFSIGDKAQNVQKIYLIH